MNKKFSRALPQQTPSKVNEQSTRRKTENDLIQLEGILKAHGDNKGVGRLQEKRVDLNDDSVLVFVIGEGNFGKSSLINHLLGREVAAVSHLPKTWRIDLYRSSPDGQEYAEIRRSNAATTQRLPIEEAIHICKQQEAEVLRYVKTNQDGNAGSGTSTLDQIIEVNWHYTNLAIPKNVVLVDTPGFLQALGNNRRQIDTLASREGVVFADLDAAYEYYYPRANLVMWAFRADRINDRDTINTFQTLSEQKKSVLGVITYFDIMKSEAERQESLRRAEELYGTKVDGFQPVITGGKTSNLGYGISELREHLVSASKDTFSIKQAEAEQFLINEAVKCQEWMTKKGDLLIENISQISFYCNTTSSGLLKEAQASNLALHQYFQLNVVPQIEAPGFSTFLKGILKEVSNLPALKAARVAGVQPSSQNKQEMADHFNRYVSEKLNISELNKQFQNRVQYISNYLEAEGKRQSAGHHLTQILIHQSNKIEKRKLQGQILPPQVKNLVVAFPALPVPIIFSSGTDELLDFIGSLGDFASGVLQMFGWQSKAKENEKLMLSAVADTKHSAKILPRQIEQAIQNYVKQAAHSILKSADEAVGNAYPGKNLIALKDDAVEIDKHLDKIQSFLSVTPMQDDSRYLYKTLFALWSPRDDPRKAVIDAFCEWYEKKEAGFRLVCRNWLDEAFDKTPLNQTKLKSAVTTYLTKTKQTQLMAGPVLVVSVDDQFIVGDVKDVSGWFSRLVQSISEKKLFDDKENFLKLKFDGFELQGIADSFGTALALGFERKLDRNISVETVFIDSKSLTALNTGEIYGIKRTASYSAIGSFVALGYGVGEHFANVALVPDAERSLALGIAIAVSVFSANWVYQILSFRQRRRDEMILKLSGKVCEIAERTARNAWQNTQQELNASLARKLIGQKTLIKKRALDFAMEGNFANIDM